MESFLALNFFSISSRKCAHKKSNCHIQMIQGETIPRWVLLKLKVVQVKATIHLTISMRVLRATGKIQKNNYHHGSCEPSLTCKTSSMPLIFTQGTHRNIENR